MGVHRGCPLSPTLCVWFFNGLHDHLRSCASTARTQPRSGKWVSCLVYADNAVVVGIRAAAVVGKHMPLLLWLGPPHQPHHDRFFFGMAQALQALLWSARFKYYLVPWLDLP